jgi:glyoxylase I family protein
MVADYSGTHWTEPDPHGPHPNCIELIPTLEVPTTVVVGELEVPSFLEMSAVLTEKIPGARKVVIPDAGHMVNLEAPEVVNPLLREVVLRARPPMGKGRIPPVSHSGCHHSAICTRDWELSMRFWTEGIGLELLFEYTFVGGWQELFGASGDTLRSAFLHDPALDDSGIVELVEFPRGIDDSNSGEQPSVGFFLLSFYVDVEKVMGRLEALGLGGTMRRTEIATPRDTVTMGVVFDPNGVMVELVGSPK